MHADPTPEDADIRAARLEAYKQKLRDRLATEFHTTAPADATALDMCNLIVEAEDAKMRGYRRLMSAPAR